MREAWPRILDRLEPISRSSWMLATIARVASYTPDDVLTLAFGSASDLTAFKKLAAGKGPSSDLRAAIAEVLGVQVKFLARHEPQTPPDAPEPPHGPGPEWPDEPPPEWPDDPRGSAAPPPRPERTAPPAPSGAARPRPSAAPPAGMRPTAPLNAAAPVTEWAVAPIPQGDGTQGTAALAVDDEPEDAASAPVAAATLVREAPRDGDVLAEADSSARDADDEADDLPAPDTDAPIPPRIAPPIAATRLGAPAVASAPRGPRAPGIERVGEAVVRQLLGATFVREEPYNAPTRFN